MYRIKTRAYVPLIAFGACIGSVQAADDEELLDALLENGAITPAQHEALLDRGEDGEIDPGDGFVTSLGEDGLLVESRSGDSSFGIGGRLHADWSRHFGESAITDAVDGTSVTRARIELGGTFQRDWAWAAEADFAGNEVELKDFTVGYTGIDDLRVTVGHQKQPYSLSLEMSSNDIPFIERSIDNSLIAPFVDRSIGVRVDKASTRWFAAAGVYGKSNDSDLPSDQGWGTTGRLVFAPISNREQVVHVGVRAAYRETETIGGAIRLRDETTDFSDLSIVDTGPISGVESVTLFGPELAAAFGPLWLASEYNRAEIERSSAADLKFDSWHVALSWAIGGESRVPTYRIGSGEFKRLTPSADFRLNRGGGTWEIAARYATLDLNSGGFTGGREETFTLAGNWLANANFRLMLDWTRVLDTDGSNAVRTEAEGLDVVAVRAQFAF